MNWNGPENGWGKLNYFSLSATKVKKITCVLILHFLVVRTCSTTTAGHQLSPFSILLTHPYHKLLSLAPNELFCELCQSSGPEVRDMSYSFLRLFLHIAECTSGKSVSSNLILPPLSFFHFFTVFSLWSVHMCLWQYLSGPAKWVAGPVAFWWMCRECKEVNLGVLCSAGSTGPDCCTDRKLTMWKYNSDKGLDKFYENYLQWGIWWGSQCCSQH